MDDIDPYLLWMIGGVLLVVAEMLVPGIYLLFVGAAAVLTGVATWMYDFGPVFQIGLFALFLLAAILIGNQVYKRNPVASSDPDLNNRSARLVGTSVTVIDAVSANGGRVKVGDGVWPARGPDLAVGETARVLHVDGGVLVLEKPQGLIES
ncbi:MAG: NfeD family protein [Novosphingopyxis baekryungensis]|jgi:membrane protein implicated in regulation of membrane protease activity|uniref:NfeD family protein n=1 Tax=Novosphingopyxis baekryungensis TaxID=279369 RepID=UPI0003B75D6B|nr:NfeD family protein [Novosphingopyxis baekryungensis]MDE0932645.1 NfeD family protein [Novosphingopyxis baekryungensis]